MYQPTELEGRPKCSLQRCGRWMSKSYRKSGKWAKNGLCSTHRDIKYKQWPFDLKGARAPNRGWYWGRKETIPPSKDGLPFITTAPKI